ncbi:MAG: hypothetical protein LC802_15535 [Acidobacteria bacterium]|nr:hypothetical protein [Acidobacteriota bacterium]
MEIENSFSVEGVEARGALCVECMKDVSAGEAVVERRGAVLCRACAGEFYVGCAGCGGLTPRDESLERAENEGMFCAECFGRAAQPGEGEAPPSEEETAALVSEFVALHAEKKRLDERMEEIKETLKRAAGARPRISNAVVLRAGDSSVRCSYAVKTAYDPDQLSAVEALLGREGFEAIFERKVTFSPFKDKLEEFLSAADEEYAAARDAISAAARQTEVTTLNVVAPKKRKSP